MQYQGNNSTARVGKWLSPKHLAKVWLANARASVTREMEFRVNFFLGLARQFLWFGIFIVFIDTIFSTVNSLSGWSQDQVLIILALSRIVEGIMGILFIRNWMTFTRTVNNGEFDFYLLRPVPVQFFTAFRYLKLDNIGGIIAGLGLMFYAFRQQVYSPTLVEVIAFAILVMAGIVIYYSLLVIVASLVFKLERLESLWGFNSLFSEPLTVPFNIFPSGVRIVLTYLLPIAFTVFIPAQALVGKIDLWFVPIGMIIAIVFLVLANLAWRAGLRRYSSASS